MIQRPVQIQIIGDENLGRRYIGIAKSQMNILKKQMSFQKLQQGVRRVRLATNVYLECFKIYTTEVCRIIAIVEKRKVVKAINTERHLLIVVGNARKALTISVLSGSFISGESISGTECSGIIDSIDSLDGATATQVIYVTADDCTTVGTTVTGGTSGAVGNISSCLDRYFQRTYEHFEFLDATPTFSELTTSAGIYNIFSAHDNSKPSEIDCNGDPVVEQEWSKVLNRFVLTAFMYYTTSPDKVHIVVPEDDDLYDKHYYWAVTASFNGGPVTIAGQINYGPFRRTINAGRHNNIYFDYARMAKTHIGFDIWQDEFGAHWISIMSDIEARLYVFKFNANNNDFELQNEYLSGVRASYYIGGHTYDYYGTYVYDFEYAHKQVRLLGYGYDQDNNEHVAYWTDIQNYAEDCASSFNYFDCYGRCHGYYYKEVLNTDTITEYVLEDQHIKSAVWDPIKRRPYLLFIDWILDSCDPETFPDKFFSYYINPEYGSVGDLSYSTGWQLEMPVECLAALDVPATGGSLAFTEGDLIGSGYWKTFEETDMDMINYLAKTFPNDDGWTSILFNGTDRAGNTYENWIIYKDIAHEEDDPAYEGYFAIDPEGNKYPIGEYDRAFFYNFTFTEEVNN